MSEKKIVEINMDDIEARVLALCTGDVELTHKLYEGYREQRVKANRLKELGAEMLLLLQDVQEDSHLWDDDDWLSWAVAVRDVRGKYDEVVGNAPG